MESYLVRSHWLLGTLSSLRNWLFGVNCIQNEIKNADEAHSLHVSVVAMETCNKLSRGLCLHTIPFEEKPEGRLQQRSFIMSECQLDYWTKTGIWSCL